MIPITTTVYMCFVRVGQSEEKSVIEDKHNSSLLAA